MFTHTLNTWLLAHLFHPFLFFGFMFLQYPEETGIEDMGILMFFFVVALLLSTPAFVLLRLALYGISNLILSAYEKFFLWLIAAPVAIILNFLGLMLVTKQAVNLDEFYFILPSIMAAIISVLLRTRSFFQLQTNIKSLNQS